MLRILALDTASTESGWALHQGEFLRFGTIKAPNVPMFQRLPLLREHVIKLAQTFGYVDLLVIEGAAFRGTTDVVPVQQATGVILEAIAATLGESPSAFIALKPSTVKKAVTGHGRAEKPAMIAWAESMGLKVANDHEADACALAYVASRLSPIEIGALNTLATAKERKRFKEALNPPKAEQAPKVKRGN